MESSSNQNLLFGEGMVYLCKPENKSKWVAGRNRNDVVLAAIDVVSRDRRGMSLDTAVAALGRDGVFMLGVEIGHTIIPGCFSGASAVVLTRTNDLLRMEFTGVSFDSAEGVVKYVENMTSQGWLKKFKFSVVYFLPAGKMFARAETDEKNASALVELEENVRGLEKSICK